MLALQVWKRDESHEVRLLTANEVLQKTWHVNNCTAVMTQMISTKEAHCTFRILEKRILENSLNDDSDNPKTLDSTKNS